MFNKKIKMGNLQASHEISIEEQEQFEMQVEEDYNPSGIQTEKEAKLEYLQRERKREAEVFRQKYLGAKAMLAEGNRNHNINEIRPTIVSHNNQKPRNDRQRRVRYEFQELGHPDNPAADKEGGGGFRGSGPQEDSLSDILHQKEKIRSLITPDPDRKEQELLNNQSKKDVVANANGRSPYKGAQLRVISVNHK